MTFYVGVDPTGPSLHVGHLVPIYALAHLAEFGHRGIVIVGGGTARIGDPSGKTEMRRMITVEEINANADRIGAQIDRFLSGAGYFVYDGEQRRMACELELYRVSPRYWPALFRQPDAHL